MLINLEVYSSLSTAPDLPLVLGGNADIDPLHIRDITGLEPVKATIGSQAQGNYGEIFTGSSVGKRNIVITVGFNPDWVNETVSSLRQKLYSYFMPQQEVLLRFFRDDGPTCEIQGYVESCEPLIFAKDPKMQISVICPLPDFVASYVSILEGMAKASALYSEFTLRSSVDTPFVAEVSGAPAYSGIVVFETQTLAPGTKKFQVAGDLDDGTFVTVESTRGAKTVKNSFSGSSETVNLLPSVTVESVWPVLKPGTNKFRVRIASETERPWTLKYFERFGGL